MIPRVARVPSAGTIDHGREVGSEEPVPPTSTGREDRRMEQRRDSLVAEQSWAIGSRILQIRRHGAVCRDVGTNKRARRLKPSVIVDTKTALQQDIGAISVGLGLLRAEHRKSVERVQEMECGLAAIQPAQEAMT
ncbi:hypothetical protein NDU88_012711 [Pleurodeles waltl]|uniref:Uncharacterized protein n=1 Tax=Pleurodeles waltl TaxID=8319 RepID=A0AAV7R6V9_PLEWA|nr:hypothetical protein NDU88_012711 [Pleurodeles waltl]